MKIETRDLKEVREEVEVIEDPDRKKVDPGIKELVIGLRMFRVDTTKSCQGHKYRPKTRTFPWVEFKSRSLEVVYEILYLWRRVYPDLIPGVESLTWTIISDRRPYIRPDDFRNLELKEMQQDAIDFGKWLQIISPKLINYRQMLVEQPWVKKEFNRSNKV